MEMLSATREALASRIVKLLLKIHLRGWTIVADMVCLDSSATFVQPRKFIFSNSFTIREGSFILWLQ